MCAHGHARRRFSAQGITGRLELSRPISVRGASLPEPRPPIRFDDDAFIGCTHLDDRTGRGRQRAGFANLRRTLEIRIGMFLGEEPHILAQSGGRQGTMCSPTLVERLQHAAVFIAVVQHHGIWRRTQHAKNSAPFLQRRQRGRDPSVDQEGRRFQSPEPVIPFPAQPLVAALLGFGFFTKDPETGAICTLDAVFRRFDPGADSR